MQEVAEALQGLRIAARGWRASRLPRVGTPVGHNPERVAPNPAMPGVCAPLTGLILSEFSTALQGGGFGVTDCKSCLGLSQPKDRLPSRLL